MFDSGIKSKTIFDEIKNEADIAIEVPDSCFVSWLNALEQLLYSEIIKEQAEYTFAEDADKKLSDIETSGDAVRFEDIHAVYAGDVQLIKSTVASGAIFPNTYYKKENDIAFSEGVSGAIKIIYNVRPTIKTTDNIDSLNVMLPAEFIELAKAKLRGESYKYANEDGLAAKWLNDYNALLETFKVWVQSKSANFGI